MATAMQRMTTRMLLGVYAGGLYLIGTFGLALRDPSTIGWLSVQAVGAVGLFKILVLRRP